jgi:hypothetical protein
VLPITKLAMDCSKLAQKNTMNHKTQACQRPSAQILQFSRGSLRALKTSSTALLTLAVAVLSLLPAQNASAQPNGRVQRYAELRIAARSVFVTATDVLTSTIALDDDGSGRGDPQANAPEAPLEVETDAQPDASGLRTTAISRRVFLPVAYASVNRAPVSAPVAPKPTATPASGAKPAPAPTATPAAGNKPGPTTTPGPTQPPPSAPPPTAPSSNAPCTIQVSADGQSGTVALSAAIAQAAPGSVICMRGGTYTINRTVSINKAGSANAWIVIRATDSTRVDVVWDPNTNVRTRGIPMIFFSGSTVAYWEVRDIHLNASNQASAGVFCRDGHHIRVINTTIQGGDEAGISTVNCDYMSAIGNRIYRGGYGRGWSSGISYNKTRWHDNYSGFHNVMIGNVISGMYDNSSYHTDGNGMILDLSAGYGGAGSELSSANTPPALIANNVVYHNGGKCIDSYGASNGWIVHNTCFENALDSALRGPGEIKIKSSKNVIVANNIAMGAQTPYLLSESTGVRLANNLQFDTAALARAAAADGEATISTNPLFMNAPTTADLYRGALPPWQVGDGLKIREGSPAIDAGVELSTLTGDVNLQRDLAEYLKVDFSGAARKQGAQVDMGAYEIQ